MGTEDPTRSMNINPGIFKAYDIRGLYPDEIDETTAKQIGRGFVSYLKALVAADAETLPPVDVSGVAPPADDTSPPTPLN